MPISAVAANFGVSRPAFYKAQDDFAREGLMGLIPNDEAPKQGYKLTRKSRICRTGSRTRTVDQNVRHAAANSGRLCRIQVHRRSAGACADDREKKTARAKLRKRPKAAWRPMLAEHYETLRACVLARNAPLVCGTDRVR